MKQNNHQSEPAAEISERPSAETMAAVIDRLSATYDLTLLDSDGHEYLEHVVAATISVINDAAA